VATNFEESDKKLSILSVSVSDHFRDIAYRSRQFVEVNVVKRPTKFKLGQFNHSGDNRGQRSNFDPYISETIRDRPTILSWELDGNFFL
jgi:hypothetical protein